MTGTVRALVIAPDGAGEVRAIRSDLDDFKAAIGGGWLEGVPLRGAFAYCDEEGKLKRLPVNLLATVLALRLGWRRQPNDFLAGPVLFVGPATPAGDDTDVPQAVLDEWAAVRVAQGQLRLNIHTDEDQ